MSKAMIEAALKKATDTKACVISEGALECIPKLFREHFESVSVILICDPRTLLAAGEKVEALFKADGVEVSNFENDECKTTIIEIKTEKAANA